MDKEINNCGECRYYVGKSDKRIYCTVRKKPKSGVREDGTALKPCTFGRAKDVVEL